MVELYFGLPGCGKTTMLAKKAYNGAFAKKSPYKHIYGNICLTGIPKYIQIKPDDLGKYMLEECLILIDEGSLCFDSRDYKNFSKAFVEFFMMHRHYNADVCIFTQGWDAVDKKIRLVCDRVYYIHKSFLTGWYKSIVWRIPYGILIPSKDSNGDKYGEIIQGYYKPPLLTRLFTPNLKRRKYYQFFDSWERKELPPLPIDRKLEQKEHNKYTYENLCNMLKNTKRSHFIKRIRLTKMLECSKKSLTSLDK